jgi:pimeloyl-ACP methyl ester carboxylesterase
MRVLYRANRPGAKVSQGVLDEFWLQGMLASIKGVYDCIKAFSETDFTADLKKFDVPTLLIHGDDDQIVPIADSTPLSAKIIKGAMLKVYKGAPRLMHDAQESGKRGSACLHQGVKSKATEDSRGERMIVCRAFG